MRAVALASGFDVAGVASVPEEGTEDAAEKEHRFTEWIASGHHGEMEWMKRADEAGTMLRTGLRVALPWARSVMVCGVNYNAAAPRSCDPAGGEHGWIARYAWSGESSGGEGRPPRAADYHDELLRRLRRVEDAMRGWMDDACQTRCYVDTGPIVERDYAVRAGVGWIGKNTCVLNQGMGSWLLLGVIVTSVVVEEGAWETPAADRCGSCTRCLDACPTDALIAPRQMDASRCIAYLTIEKKGSIAEELRAGMGRQVFGCDICQDVCPWNRRAPVAPAAMWPVRGELVNPALAWLAAMSPSDFKQWFRGSPLERTGRKRLLRNVAIAMGNSGDAAFLPTLEAWQRGEDEVLREAAAWAVARLKPID